MILSHPLYVSSLVDCKQPPELSTLCSFRSTHHPEGLDICDVVLEDVDIHPINQLVVLNNEFAPLLADRLEDGLVPPPGDL